LYNLPGTVWLLHFLEMMYPLDVRHSCPQRGECSCFAYPYLGLMNAEINKKNSAVIHALLFAWYLEGNFFIFLKHRGFGDFPITIGTCLSLPSLFTQSITVTFPESFEDLV
jgi:hypothetical protein